MYGAGNGVSTFDTYGAAAHDGYATYDGLKANSTAGPQKKHFISSWSGRHRLNVVSILMSILVPWAIFSILFALLSLNSHIYHQQVVYTVVGLSGVTILLAITGYALGRAIKPDRTPSWILFIMCTTVIAWIFAVGLGFRSFQTTTEPYEHWSHMRHYTDVSPSTSQGQQFMDGATMTFSPHSTIDLSKSMAFKNQQTYCVAPLTDSSSTTKYDFWIVGLNCCTPGSSTPGASHFDCGRSSQLRHQPIHSLRWSNSADKPFFRLAVQQAEATYNISAPHPNFFRVVRNADLELNRLENNATQHVLLGIIGYFIFQSLAAVTAALISSKMM